MEPIEVKLACLGHALSSQPSPFKEDSQSRTINDTQSNIGRFLLSEEEALSFSVTYGIVPLIHVDRYTFHPYSTES